MLHPSHDATTPASDLARHDGFCGPRPAVGQGDHRGCLTPRGQRQRGQGHVGSCPQWSGGQRDRGPSSQGGCREPRARRLRRDPVADWLPSPVEAGHRRQGKGYPPVADHVRAERRYHPPGGSGLRRRLLRRVRKSTAQRYYQLLPGNAAIGSLHDRMAGPQRLESDECWWRNCGKKQTHHHLFTKCKAWAPQIRRLWERIGRDCKWEHPRAPSVCLSSFTYSPLHAARRAIATACRCPY